MSIQEDELKSESAADQASGHLSGQQSAAETNPEPEATAEDALKLLMRRRQLTPEELQRLDRSMNKALPQHSLLALTGLVLSWLGMVYVFQANLLNLPNDSLMLLAYEEGHRGHSLSLTVVLAILACGLHYLIARRRGEAGKSPRSRLATLLMLAGMLGIWSLPGLLWLNAYGSPQSERSFEAQIEEIVPQQSHYRSKGNRTEWDPFWRLNLTGPDGWHDSLRIRLPDGCPWLEQLKVGDRIRLSLRRGLPGYERVERLEAMDGLQASPCSH